MEKYSGIEFSEGSDLRKMSISVTAIILAVSVPSVCLERPRQGAHDTHCLKAKRQNKAWKPRETSLLPHGRETESPQR